MNKKTCKANCCICNKEMIVFTHGVKPSICMACYRTMDRAKELEYETGKKVVTVKRDIGDNKFELVILDLDKEGI